MINANLQDNNKENKETKCKIVKKKHERKRQINVEGARYKTFRKTDMKSLIIAIFRR